MLPDNFHFIRPYWLLALSVLFLLPLYAGQNARIISSWKKACDPHLLKRLLSAEIAKSSYIPIILLIIGWIGGVIALAGPTWEKYPTPIYNITEPTIFVLDASSYMGDTDLPPLRLKRAIYKIDDYIKSQNGGQFGLVLYADDAYVIVPLSYDAKIITNLLPNIDLKVMPQDGARIDRAISIARENLKNSGATSGKIVLLSSGECEGLDDAIKEADKSEQAGFRVHAIGIYQNKKDDRLSYIAKAGGGSYSQISTSDGDISVIIKDVNTKDNNLKQLTESSKKMDVWKDVGKFITIIPLICMLFAFRKGWIVSLIFTLSILNANPAMAFSWQDLWSNQAQKAEQAVKEQDFKKASSLFKDNSSKAAAYYKQGDYKKAIELLKNSSETEDMYNLGNSYAKSGDTKNAIATYEELLKQQPNHEDAKYNLEYLKKQQKSGGGSNSESDKNQSQGDKKEQQSNSSKDNQDNQKQDNQEQNSSQQEQQKQGDEQKQDEQNKSDNSDKQEQSSSQEDEGSQDKQQNAEKNNEQNSKDNQSSEEDKQQQQQEQASPSNPEEQKQGDFDSQSLAQVPDQENKGKPDEKKLSHEQYYSVIEDDPSGLIRNMILMQYRQRAMENR